MKILINTPHLSKPGGVANHYKGLKEYWKQDVKYNYIGGRKWAPGVLILPYDFLKFFFLCWHGNYHAIILNPSLGIKAIKRDAVFLSIAKFFGIKVIVFFHGWNKQVADDITLKPAKFIKKYQKSDAFIVLASSFKKQLQEWTFTQPIFLSTTKVDNKLLNGFTIAKKRKNNTILFLARLEENKGIFIALSAFKLVLETHPNSTLLIAGTGSAFEEAQNMVKTENIPNVTFLGNITGFLLNETFSISTIYILPTTHGEGMPTSVLEAMAFGLPIISRPVGGLLDFFEENKMGFLIKSVNPQAYAAKIKYLLENEETRKIISKYNHQYAIEKFMASQVAFETEQILINSSKNGKL